ncbi:MAG: DUF4011 domain-containing protein, partial [Candidatus Sumerlaeia bacterium]|nr:DUF4011 domain-containing protein [Candidatus Sumerlaeia bacterium]
MAADSRTANRIVEALLDRLYATLARGPAINCAPHHSRQRIDLTELERLGEATAGSLLAELLGPEGKCRVRPEMAKLPPKPASADDEPPEVRTQRRANEQRQQLLRKLSTIASDADSYRRDTGAHVLYVGYPILSLPEAPAGKLRATSRILAPLAFVPVELRVSTGTRPFVELLCSESGADRVVPNVALKAWLEHQLGRRFPELFDDEEGEDPLREIAELTREVCRLLEMPEAPPLTGWPVTRMPLSADLPDAPTVLTGVVLGMYPLRNQATIQDMEALHASEEFPPTVRPFLTLEATQAAGDDEVYGDDNDKGTSLVAPVDEHLIDRADPCQRRAVLRARDAHGLVIHGPPGTGKSQTITNIIGDCLARQKRVLLVCEKRTALDVVKHRLDARGLGPLCAVVHDATHDRTPLYMGLREQLEGLAGAPEPADPSRQLKRVNDEIARLEADLRAYYDALAANDERLGEAFHDIAGRWLLAGGETFPPRADTLPPGVTDLDPEDMLAREGDVRGLVRRLLAARAGDNAWEGRHATTLEDYMTQSPPAIREALRNAAEAAGKSRALAVRELPPFPESVAGEGAFRRDLAARVRQLEAAVPLTLRRAVLVRGAAGWDALRQALAQVAAWRTVLERGPLDADLFATFALSPWEAGRVVTAVAHLTEYLARGQGFAGFFRFGVRSRAREALAPLGLVANAVNAARGKTFLEGVHARNLLRGFWNQHLAADVPVPADDVGLRAGLDALTALLDGVAHVERHPGGAPMVSAMTAALLAPEGAGEFAARLDRSADHAAALEVAVGALERVPLLTAPARAALRDKLLHGGEADADLERLREDIDVLEPLLRFEAEARTFPAAVGTALRTFVATDDDEDGAWR